VRVGPGRARPPGLAVGIAAARTGRGLTDGRRIIATRWNDTLSILRTGGVVVLSEPYYDDPGWADVPDHHLVDVADGVVTVTELEA
jgi:glutamine amidotransferase